MALTADSATVEFIRQSLLESTAAVRRGDYTKASILPSDENALSALVERRRLIKCTFRPLPRGGELSLLSDDAETVAAIQRLLAQSPPPAPKTS